MRYYFLFLSLLSLACAYVPSSQADAPLDGYQKLAQDVAAVDPEKMDHVAKKKLAGDVGKVLDENLNPETAQVVKSAVEAALKEEGETDAENDPDSLANKADAAVEENVPEKKRKCAALKVCKGRSICPCDDKKKEDDPEDELDETVEDKTKETETDTAEDAADKAGESKDDVEGESSEEGSDKLTADEEAEAEVDSSSGDDAAGDNANGSGNDTAEEGQTASKEDAAEGAADEGAGASGEVTEDVATDEATQ